ncbi:MAG: putative DNA-binding domain-containing protein [Rhodobiaceae bacterium]|nr:putative DNA-binding domain-containing protein [Rhodobiaceae bacterium]
MSAQPEAGLTGTGLCEAGQGQDAFTRALLDPDVAVPANIARLADGRVAARRFAVYRNNVIVSLTEYLAASFPTVAGLVGEEFFAAMAGVFIRHSPPVSPILAEYGGGFADFIAGFAPAASVPYLADSARLDNAQRVAYHAADAEPAGGDTLKRLETTAPFALRLVLHPSLAVVRSRWPVLSIWQANRGERSGALPEGGEDVLVLRPRLDVALYRLAPGAVAFIGSIRSGCVLGDAAEAAIADSDAFDLAETLALLIREGAIIDITTD